MISSISTNGSEPIRINVNTSSIARHNASATFCAALRDVRVPSLSIRLGLGPQGLQTTKPTRSSDNASNFYPKINAKNYLVWTNDGNCRPGASDCDVLS